VYDDALAVARPWGFAPGAVQTPVWIWQGDADTSVLPALAQELAGQLPHCSFTLLPGEGTSSCSRTGARCSRCWCRPAHNRIGHARQLAELG
jgi:hypothetical protein